MKKRKIIDISTEEKKKEVFEKFDSFNSKNQAHEYFGISDNKQGSEYLKQIANEVGFDLSIYKERKNKPLKYCKQCGKEITSKWAKEFCSSSCAAKYNNERRDKSVYKMVASKLRKEGNKIEKQADSGHKKNRALREITCEFCGKKFETRIENAKYCSTQCQANSTHKKAYKDFLEKIIFL